MSNEFYKFTALSFALLIANGCEDKYPTGSCVYIEEYNTGKVDTYKADYFKYDDGAHWFFREGKIGALSKGSAAITGCGNY